LLHCSIAVKFSNETMKQLNNEKLFAFILGRETKIARLELESVLRRFCFCSDKNNPESCRGMDYSILSVVDNVAIIKIEPHRSFTQIDADNFTTYNLQPTTLIKLLGGTVKIFEIVGMGSNNLIDDIVKIVQENSIDMSGKLNFGISDYRSNEVRTKLESSRPKVSNDINKIGLSVKKILKKSHNTRFIALRDSNELSSIVSYKNKLDSKGVEIGLFEISNSKFLISNQIPNPNDPKANKLIPNSCFLGRLVAVTNPEEWSKRDYDKPRGDKYSGMTPPKLARMLLNITLSRSTNIEARSTKQTQNSKIENLKHVSDFGFRISDLRPVVVDPFCGSGNILMEAAMLGCEVVGFDISEKAVNDTKSNINWLQQNFQLSISNFQSRPNSQISNSKFSNNNATIQQCNNAKIFQADATKFDFSLIFANKLIPNKLIPVIVTEPYLGQPKKFAPSMNAARGEYQKVKNLYLDFLKNLQVNSYPSRLARAEADNLQVICVIFPLVETQEGKQFSLLNECIDEIKEMGYTLVCEPFVYGREYQVVKRQVVLLQLT